MQIIDLTTLARYDHDLKEWLPIRRVLHQNPYDDPNDGWEIGVELVVGGVASGNNIPIKIMPDGGIFIQRLGGYNGDSDVGGCVDLVTVIDNKQSLIDAWQGTASRALKLNNPNNVASGARSTAMGHRTTADAANSCAMGMLNIAHGTVSLVSGLANIANGYNSNAEGCYAYARGNYSKARGYSSLVAKISITGAANATTYQFTTSSSFLKYFYSLFGETVLRNLIIGNAIAYNSTNIIAWITACTVSVSGNTISGTITTDKTLSSSAISNVNIDLPSTISYADNSHVEGTWSATFGEDSFVFGCGLYSTNRYETALGVKNKSHKTSDTFGNAGNTLFSIGCGTDDTANRKNSIEVMQNGDVYVKGVGGYDGTNPNTSGVSALQSLVGKIPTTYPSNPSAGSCYFSRNGFYGNLHIYDGNDWFVVGMQIEAVPD